jgi:hypothetical protein
MIDKIFGCHCDLEPHMIPDGCVIDTGKIHDCAYAHKFQAKEQCEYWIEIDAKNPKYQGVFERIAELRQQREYLLAQLKELRRWVGDGIMSDDNCIDNYYSPAYKAMIEQTDAEIAKAS